MHVSASIGVSLYPNDGGDAGTLLKCADTAMYRAKESGRSTYRFYLPKMNERAVARMKLEGKLARGASTRRIPTALPTSSESLDRRNQWTRSTRCAGVRQGIICWWRLMNSSRFSKKLD